MHDIELKSIGFMIDEYITADMKVMAGIPGATNRSLRLFSAIMARVNEHNRPYPDGIVEKLRSVSKTCWDAQSIVMDDSAYVDDVAEAARIAQRMNAKRNLIIREIDAYFGETDITQLSKTYAKEDNGAILRTVRD